MAAVSLICLSLHGESYLIPNVKSKPVSNVVDTTKLGTLTVPVVGCGTISWTSNSLFSLENEELEDVVSAAYRSNAAFFDTAERYGSHFKTAFGMGYGETERLTNLLVRKAKVVDGPTRVDPVIASKFTPLPWRTTVESVVEACEQSCKNLGVDSIDLYQIHMPDIVQPLRAFGKVETKDTIYWDGIAKCYNEGLIKNVGVCNYGPTLVEQCYNALAERGLPLASNQIAFSLLGRKNGSLETIQKCNELGVKVLAYYPFAMGLLTGKYSKDTLKHEGGDGVALDTSLTTRKKTSLEQQDLLRYASEEGFVPLITAMSDIAERRRKTISQVALNYIISKDVIPIPGCRTVSQLEDNLGAMGWRLSETEIKRLELLADELPNFDGAGFKRTNEKFVGYGIERWELD
ncbi:aldehyde reductase [Nitzschia inconspicua]|uniref:Aldehyde reductase n=1 Tax=Nitzschia inconspicua TaxID=303405 RepID=A0A9K3L5K7_9STRA|nr:aldehyde reductase [Nitzschia inconspicua]